MTITPIVEPGVVEDGVVQQVTAAMRGMQQDIDALVRQLAETKAKAAELQTLINRLKAQLAAARERLALDMEG